MSSKDKDNGLNRIFNQALSNSRSNPDINGSSKSNGRTGSNGTGVTRALSEMRGGDSLESMPKTSFGVDKSKRGDKGPGSSSKGGAEGSGWSSSWNHPQPNATASGSRTRAPTNSKNEVEWKGEPVLIQKPTAPKPPHQPHSGQKRSAAASRYMPGQNTLDPKKPASSPSFDPKRPPQQNRDASRGFSSSGFSKPPATANPPDWGANRGQPAKTGQEWLRGIDETNNPSPTQQPSNQQVSKPSGSGSNRRPEASPSSRPSTSHGTISAPSKSRILLPPDQQELLEVSSDEDGPLKPPPPPTPPPKNAVAGPSTSKKVATAMIDRTKAKRISVDRAPTTSKPKPTPEIHAISSDDDEIEEFTQAENNAIARGQPFPSSSSHHPPPPNSSRSRPTSAAGPSHSQFTKPPPGFSVPPAKVPLPNFKKKEKAQLAGESDDELPAAVASTSHGAVKRKVSQYEATQQPLPMQPVVNMGGISKKMRGKEGQIFASPSEKPTSSSSSSKRAPPTERGEPGHKTFPVVEWWRGFAKQSGRSNLQIGGDTFKIGSASNHDGDLTLAFGQVLEMNVSVKEPFLVSLKLSDDGDLEKIIRSTGSTTKHAYAKDSITFLFSPQKSDELLDFLAREFGRGRTTIFCNEIDQDDSELLLDLLKKTTKPRPKPVTNQPHPFTVSVPSGSSTRNMRSSVGAAAVTEIDASDDEPELLVPKPKTRPPRPPCVNPTEVMATWPLVGKGQFDITKGDYHRTLDDVEFLNDTMIEYGLRSALAEAIKTMPELEDEVHIFSTFLYTKLSAKKKTKEGDPWDVVARWTRKFDIFKKKFLIVPINEDFHWYLAIIVNPAAVLRPPEIKIPPEPTTTTRSRNSSGGSHIDVDAPSPHPSPPSQQQPKPETQPPNAEAVPSNSTREDDIDEIEQILEPNQGSPRDEDVGERVGRPAERRIDDVTMEEVEGNVRNLSLERLAPGDDDVEMKEPTKDESGSNDMPADATAPPGPSAHPITEKVAAPAPATEHGYIFTLDSLGSAHPAAGKLLNRYLASEAKNRKRLPFEPIPLTTKKLDVPTQPDYSSCGVYMIHYVECLFRDPDAVVAFGGADSRLKAVAQKRDTLWRKSELPDARKRLKESVDGLVEAWRIKRLEEGSSDQAKPLVAAGAEGAVVAQKPSEEKSVVVASEPQPQPQPSTSTSTSTSASTPSDQDQQKTLESSKVDKGKGREVPIAMDEYKLASSSSAVKSPNPFAKPEPTAASKSPNPFTRDSAPRGPAPTLTDFHFGANPPPFQPVASPFPPPPPPSQRSRPSPPPSPPSEKGKAWKTLTLEPEGEEDGGKVDPLDADIEHDEIDSSDSEDHRVGQGRSLGQQPEVEEDFAHGQLDAKGKTREKRVLDKLLSRESSSGVSSSMTDPPFQSLSRHPSPPPLPPLPPLPSLHDPSASSSHQPPPTFRGLAPATSQHLELPRSRSSSRRNSSSTRSRENSTHPHPDPDAPTTSRSRPKSVFSSPPPEPFIPPSGVVSRVRSAPSASSSRPKEEVAARSSSDVFVEIPSRRNGSGPGPSRPSSSRSPGKRSAKSNQELQPPPSKKANIDDPQQPSDQRTYSEKFNEEDPLSSAPVPQTPRPGSQSSKSTKKGATSSNAAEVGSTSSRKGSNNSSNGSKPSSQPSRSKPSSQANYSTDAQPADQDDQEDDPLLLEDDAPSEDPSKSRFFPLPPPSQQQPNNKRKLQAQESIPEDSKEDDEPGSEPLKSTTKKKKKTKREVQEDAKRKKEDDVVKAKEKQDKQDEENRNAKEAPIDLTED